MYSSSNIHSSRGQHSQQQVATFTAAGGSIHSSRGQHSQQQGATFTAAGGNIHNSRSNIHSSRGNTHPQKQHCSAAGATLIHRSSIAQQKQQQNFTAAQ